MNEVTKFITITERDLIGDIKIPYAQIDKLDDAIVVHIAKNIERMSEPTTAAFMKLSKCIKDCKEFPVTIKIVSDNIEYRFEISEEQILEDLTVEHLRTSIFFISNFVYYSTGKYNFKTKEWDYSDSEIPEDQKEYVKFIANVLEKHDHLTTVEELKEYYLKSLDILHNHKDF